MVKYKNKNLKITLSLVVSTMSIIMTNCMDGQGSGSSSSSSQKALDVLLGSSVVKVTEHDSKINVLQDKVRELEEEVNDLRNQLDLQQSVRQLELLQLRDPLVTEQHASWTIVDLMRHIEDLSRQRVEDREYINQQGRDLSRQRGEDGYLSQHIRENIRQLSIHSICFGLVPILSALGFYTYLIELLTQSIYWVR